MEGEGRREREGKEKRNILSEEVGGMFNLKAIVV